MNIVDKKSLPKIAGIRRLFMADFFYLSKGRKILRQAQNEDAKKFSNLQGKEAKE
jgi:hypothetical protein